MDFSYADNPLKHETKGRVLWLLFYNFLKIATFIVGGGYAIVLAAERVFVERLKWLSKEELFDAIALFQTIPGLMAGNAAVYIGYRAGGYWGALVAVIAVALPSFVIITLVSLGFAFLPLDNGYVQGAFVGARAAMAGLTLTALIKMFQNSKIDYFWIVLMLVCAVGVLVNVINPAWFLLGGAILGISKVYIQTIYNIKKDKI